MGGDGEVSSSVAYGDSFSLRVKSRLRRLRFDTRLRAPLGEAFSGGSPPTG